MSTLTQPEFLDMPRMKAQFIVATLLALVTGTAAASDWQLVVTTSKGNAELIDAASLTRHGNIVRAWTRTVYAEPFKEGGKRILSDRSRFYYDCKERRGALKQTTYYTDKEFNELAFNGPSTDDELLEWFDVPPDTLGEAKLEFACANAPK